MSRPARGEWIEILYLRGRDITVKSRPARGEWIEINEAKNAPLRAVVSPREGRVD